MILMLIKYLVSLYTLSGEVLQNRVNLKQCILLIAVKILFIILLIIPILCYIIYIILLYFVILSQQM